MNTLIKLAIMNSPNKNNKDIPATDFWRLLQDHITKNTYLYDCVSIYAAAYFCGQEP